MSTLEMDAQTKRDHQAAIADTGDAYTAWHGWILTCCWCDYEVHGATKAACALAMQQHYRPTGCVIQ